MAIMQDSGHFTEAPNLRLRLACINSMQTIYRKAFRSQQLLARLGHGYNRDQLLNHGVVLRGDGRICLEGMSTSTRGYHPMYCPPNWH